IQELAQVLGVTTEEIVTASDALRDPASLHEQLCESEGDSITLMDQMKDEKSEQPFDYIPLKELLTRLEPREQSIIYLRYFSDCTQTEIAIRLGISQVQVSRLEKKILAQFKSWMATTATVEQE
ncbi:sigma-70 family RNA polymerase sigma factor, partial [Lysinibacillus sp. D4B1_S16]|uniref:sigma-70 family RNA polymerase sigma factor n=1 Tax=Lysinibacillus sp. D4B1_S16 TaxID=2941231 RepID=UPI0020C166FC